MRGVTLDTPLDGGPDRMLLEERQERDDVVDGFRRVGRRRRFGRLHDLLVDLLPGVLGRFLRGFGLSRLLLGRSGRR